MENATKRAPLERSTAAFDPAIKDLLATKATKPGFCALANQLEQLYLPSEDFGTPISIEAGGGGRPIGGVARRRSGTWPRATCCTGVCYIFA